MVSGLRAFAADSSAETIVADRSARGRSMGLIPPVLIFTGLALGAFGFVLRRAQMGGAVPQPAGGIASSGRMVPLTFEEGQELQPSLAPGGRAFVYVANQDGDLDIHLQRVGGLNPINLTPDSEGNDFYPVFSPPTQRASCSAQRGKSAGSLSWARPGNRCAG